LALPLPAQQSNLEPVHLAVGMPLRGRRDGTDQAARDVRQNALLGRVA